MQQREQFMCSSNKNSRTIGGDFISRQGIKEERRQQNLGLRGETMLPDVLTPVLIHVPCGVPFRDTTACILMWELGWGSGELWINKNTESNGK